MIKQVQFLLLLSLNLFLFHNTVLKGENVPKNNEALELGEDLSFLLGTWQGNFLQISINLEYPIILEVDQIDGSTFSGTITYPTFSNSITRMEGFCRNDSIIFSEVELLQGSNILLNGTYIVPPSGVGNTTLSGSWFFPDSDVLGGIFALTTDNPIAETVIVGEAEGSQGEEILLPIVVQNLNIDLASFQGVFSIVDNAIAQLVGVEGGLIGDLATATFNPNTGSFSYFNSGNETITLGNQDTLFYLRILLTGVDGDETPVLFGSGIDFPVEIFATNLFQIIPAIEDGLVRVRNVYEVNGLVSTHWGVGMRDVEVALIVTPPNTNSDFVDLRTDANGNYNLGEMIGGSNLSVTPERDTNIRNGISAAGLFAAQRFLLSLDIPEISSPFQIMAGDANCNGQLTTFDLFLIQNVQVGNRDSFPECPSWRFLPVTERDNFTLAATYHPNYPFPTNAIALDINENIDLDFIGVKTGDILSRANPDGLVETTPVQLAPSEESATATFYLNKQYTSNPTIIEYQLVLGESMESISYQFSLGFNAQKLRFLKVGEGLTIPSAGQILEGALNLSWFSSTGEAQIWEQGDKIVTLQFQILEQEESDFWISEEGLVPVIHDATFQPWAINLKTTQTTNLDPIGGNNHQLVLFQNQPNPFRQSTLIRFYLPESTETQLIIRDALGRIIWEKRKYYTSGNQEEELSINLPNGMYWYSLKTSNALKTKAMLVK